MAAVVENFQPDSHSKTKALWTSKFNHLQTQGGGELLKVQGNRIEKVNTTDRKSKQAVELMKLVLKKRIRNVNIKEGKPNREFKRICICAPPTHDGSFKCRFHRIGSANKPGNDKKSNRSFSSRLSCDKNTYGVALHDSLNQKSAALMLKN